MLAAFGAVPSVRRPQVLTCLSAKKTWGKYACSVAVTNTPSTLRTSRRQRPFAPFAANVQVHSAKEIHVKSRRSIALSHRERDGVRGCQRHPTRRVLQAL